MSNQLRSLTPHLPLISEVTHFIRILNDTPYHLYRSTYNDVLEQRGTPQETIDWSAPETWISERLSGNSQDFASKIWMESNKQLNPRYLLGSWLFSQTHQLLLRNESNILKLTKRGNSFIGENETIFSEIDEYEGTLETLKIVAEKGPGWRKDFLDEFGLFCRTYTRYRRDSSIKNGLRNRLNNLVARNYVHRSGLSYEIRDEGLAYLERNGHRLASILSTPAQNKLGDLRRLSKSIRQEARNNLMSHLLDMNPFKFEELVKFLLEEMGYNDVEVTSPTNDKGVDVVANIELGISSVREVVQVKRHRGNINRRVLDQLRGSLHRFQAVRGTIISTGGFSKGTLNAAFENGAAPITLIDGNKLLDLLIQNEIGVRKQEIEYYEFDNSKLTQFDDEEVSTLE